MAAAVIAGRVGRDIAENKRKQRRKWAGRTEAKIRSDVTDAFDKFDDDADGSIDAVQLRKVFDQVLPKVHRVLRAQDKAVETDTRFSANATDETFEELMDCHRKRLQGLENLEEGEFAPVAFTCLQVEEMLLAWIGERQVISRAKRKTRWSAKTFVGLAVVSLIIIALVVVIVQTMTADVGD